MNWMLAIDPGDKHVGWATWLGYGRSEFRAGELEAGSALRWIEDTLAAHERMARLVVIEEFVLYGHKAREQYWQPMRTAEMIGAIKWICEKAQVEWIEQGAGILKVTGHQLERRGIDLLKEGPHAKSAQLHLWHRILRDGLHSGQVDA